MPTVPAGPFELVDVGLPAKAPLYVISFDKDGVCTSPQSRRALIDSAARDGFTHIFLFSHGWNNDFPDAIDRYRSFFKVFRLAREQAAAFPSTYKPLLVGIFWPSTALVFGDEKGPAIAALPIDSSETESASVMREADEIAALLTPDERTEFYELVTAPVLDKDGATRLAGLLLPRLPDMSDPEDRKQRKQQNATVTPDDLVATWRTFAAETGMSVTAGNGSGEAGDEEEPDPSQFGMAGAPPASAAGGNGSNGASPEAAGFFSFLDPRPAIRLVTVHTMKDRAGVVGSTGVSPLLRELIAAAPAARTHLIGHSYGGKLLLSAICAGTPLRPGAVTSVLLLQPAMNFWCFASNVDGEGFAGGYRGALNAVKQPILCTFTPHDFALRRAFHLAVTRKIDIGEAQIAGPIEPDRYGALGGWGHRGCPAPEGDTIAMPRAGTPYPNLAAGPLRVIALDGERTVGGHGDIVTPHTAWALLQQVLAG